MKALFCMWLNQVVRMQLQLVFIPQPTVWSYPFDGPGATFDAAIGAWFVG